LSEALFAADQLLPFGCAFPHRGNLPSS